MMRFLKADICVLAALLIGFASPVQAHPQFSQPHGISASWSPFENWHVQVCSPVLFGPNATIPTVGLAFNKSFPVGQALADEGWLSRFVLGVGTQGFAPVNFDRMYLSANLGLSHSTRLHRDFVLAYGVRYAPLYEVGVFQNPGQQTGYQGLLGDASVRFRLAGQAYTTLGVQAGWYYPFSGADPVFVVQPLAGVNLAF